MLKFLIFLFTIILIFLFARRNQRFYIVRTIVLLIKYILVPLLIIYYINTDFNFFYNDDTSLYTIVDYIANPLNTNYLSENILYRVNSCVDNSLNPGFFKISSPQTNALIDNSTNTNINDGNWSNKDKEEAFWTVGFIIVVVYIHWLFSL